MTVNVHRLLSAIRPTQSVLYNWLPNHGIHQSQLNYLFLSLTSAWTNILYISGRINGATWGIWISETSRQNSAKTKNCVINLGNNIEKHCLFSLWWMNTTTHRHMESQAKQKWFARPSNKRYPSWWRKKRWILQLAREVLCKSFIQHFWQWNLCSYKQWHCFDSLCSLLL